MANHTSPGRLSAGLLDRPARREAGGGVDGRRRARDHRRQRNGAAGEGGRQRERVSETKGIAFHSAAKRET